MQGRLILKVLFHNFNSKSDYVNLLVCFVNPTKNSHKTENIVKHKSNKQNNETVLWTCTVTGHLVVKI